MKMSNDNRPEHPTHKDKILWSNTWQRLCVYRWVDNLRDYHILSFY